MNTLLLGALLHDLGKVGQRAGLPGKHQEIGSSALRSLLPPDLEAAASLASMHHDSSIFSSSGYGPLKILILADWISAGERTRDEESSDAAAPLLSVFSGIDIGKGAPSRPAYYPPVSLKISREAIFPGDAVPEIKEVYKKAWQAMINDFAIAGRIQDPEAYFTTSLYLLKRHAWAVPSAAYKSVPDISLYDHSRSACAIAACIKEEEIEEVYKEVQSDIKGKERFLLVAGDVSGIQSFLYTITSKGAVKGLRGRSLYLQLLSEATAKFILRELGYPTTNLIYSGGGHFYLLISASDEKRLEALKQDLERSLLSMHHGDLFLALGWSRLTAQDLRGGTSDSGPISLPSKWSEALNAADKAKLRRFSSLASEAYEEIFGPDPREIGGRSPTCDVCKREGQLWSRTERGWTHWDFLNDEPAFCDLCKTFEKMGEDLAKADFLVEASGVRSASPDEPSLLCNFEPLGVCYYTCRKKDLSSCLKSLKGSKVVIYSFDPDGFIDGSLASIASESGAALGFRLIGRTTPMKEGKIADTSTLAKLSNGISRIGILRMDADDLGLIFSSGLGRNATLSRISTLSTMISIFFDGWVDRICSSEAGRIYLIYSGGDDLFLIGSWDAIPKIALQIRKDFMDYTCSNPNFTISGGISVVDGKYPIYKAAVSAKKALEKAKGLDKKGKQKDAIFFLNEALSWTEMLISFKMAYSLESWMKEGREGKFLPRSILGSLYTAWELYHKNLETLEKKLLSPEEIERLARYDRWRWRLIYFLDRAGGRTKLFEADLVKLKTSILEGTWEGIVSPRDLISYLGVPARWAELLTREVSDEPR